MSRLDLDAAEGTENGKNENRRRCRQHLLHKWILFLPGSLILLLLKAFSDDLKTTQAPRYLERE